jgi:DNA-binding NtrC family response regulator
MRQGNILLISDESPIFSALYQALTEAGYQVATAHYTLEAFQALRTGNYPLVITCLTNDWTDTRPFLKAVRDLNQEITVIILRVEHEFCSPLDAYVFKGDSYLSMPCGWSRLHGLLDNCLRAGLT